MPKFEITKRHCYIAGIVLTVILMLVFLRPFTIVSPGHRGIVIRLGAVDSQSLPEGLSLKMPLITTIHQVSIQQQTREGSAPCYSSDLQQVNIQFKALYRLSSDRVVDLFQKYTGNPYETLVEPRIQAGIKEQVSLMRAEDSVKNREKVRSEAIKTIRDNLAGLIELSDLVIVNIDLSDEMERAIEKKQIAEQQALAMQYELQRAEKQAEIMIVEAKAEAESVRIKGEAIAKSPEIISLEIAKKWNGVTPQAVMSSQGGADILLPIASLEGK